MNLFFAENWYKRYQNLTQCSPGHPFVRKVKGEVESFTDPEQLIKYLKESEDAIYMWSDCEDFAILSDMYQIRIKIITTKGIRDKNPTVTWIYPDKNMVKYAELKNVQLDDMVILHENDTHFNLIVSKDSDLATLGSLSYRFNIGPMEKKTSNNSKINKPEEGDITDDDLELNDKDELMYIDDLKKQLKTCENSKMNLHKEYLKCQTELKKKTEETEILKTELKDLKEIIKLEEDLKNKNIDTNSKEKEDETNEFLPQMVKNIRAKTKPTGKSTPSTKFQKQEEEFNCIECDFQGTRKYELIKHISLKHSGKQEMNDSIKCRICGEQFNTKWNLMHHRKEKHMNAVAFCRNKSQGSCSFTDDMCWWSREKGNCERMLSL